MLGAVRRIVGQLLTNSDPAWVNATLVNSWSSFGGGYPAVGFRKRDNNEVEFRGMLTRATPASSVAFNLPAQYRPTVIKRFPIADTNVYVLTIDANGDVSVVFTGSVPPTAFAPLDVVRYVP